jgi:hypothetical protein
LEEANEAFRISILNAGESGLTSSHATDLAKKSPICPNQEKDMDEPASFCFFLEFAAEQHVEVKKIVLQISCNTKIRKKRLCKPFFLCLVASICFDAAIGANAGLSTSNARCRHHVTMLEMFGSREAPLVLSLDFARELGSIESHT